MKAFLTRILKAILKFLLRKVVRIALRGNVFTEGEQLKADRHGGTWMIIRKTFDPGFRGTVVSVIKWKAGQRFNARRYKVYHYLASKDLI